MHLPLSPDQRLWVTAGAGGVGKTTIAASLAVQAAIAGRKVAVLTIDPARRLADSLGLGALTGELRQVDTALFETAGIEPEGELWAMMLDVHTTSDQMVHRFAPDPETAQAILDNTYYGYFSTSLSGSQEYMAVEQVRSLVADPRFDLVVLDTPPAANALEFLEAPDRLLEALDSKTMQLIQTQKNAGLGARLFGKGRELILKSLNVMTGGEFIDDLVEFFTVFGSILDALKEASEKVHAMLREDSSSFLLVTAPTPSNVDEALHFHATLQERGLPFGAYIANRVHAPYPIVAGDAETLSALADELPPPVAQLPQATRVALIKRLMRGLDDHHRMAERDAAALTVLEATDEPLVRVPLFPLDVRDLAGLARVGRHLLG